MRYRNDQPRPASSGQGHGPHRAPRVGVLVVAYNAEQTIGQVLGRIRPATWERLEELFVFDDCSRDATAEATVRYRDEHGLHKVRVFRNCVNLGYGGNQKRGYRYAIERGLDVVVLLHGDGQYAPELLDDLIDPITREEADAVFGSRMLTPGGARSGGMPLYKRLGNRVLTAFQNRVLGLNLSEYHTGYRAYRVETLRRQPLDKNSNDFHFDNEIILQCHAAGDRIAEVPIPTHYGSEVCHVNGMKYAWNVVRTTFSYRLHKAGLRYSARFDVQGGDKYVYKAGPHSSHTQILEHVGRHARGVSLDILDVGSGRGRLATRLTALGHRVVGVDSGCHPEARSACARFVRADIAHGFGLADEQFDCIIFADVLEHLANPEEVLLLARKHLKPAGFLVASTGNVANIFIRTSLLLGRFCYTERGILDRTHLRLFTRSTFRRILVECGFRTSAECPTPIPFELVLPRWRRTASLLEGLNYVAARVWPGLFAYQVLLVAEHDPVSELRRQDEIDAAGFIEFHSGPGVHPLLPDTKAREAA